MTRSVIPVLFDDGGARLLMGDCVELMDSLPPNSVDAVVTDPPYGIRFMGAAGPCGS